MSTSLNRVTPVQALLQYPDRIASLSAGDRFSLALQRPRRGGAIMSAWGFNGSGQLGDGTLVSTNTPVQNLVSGAVMVAAGFQHGLAMALDGRVWAWGNNASGQLGDGTTQDRASPFAVFGFGSSDTSSSTGDPDGDGLPTWQEIELGTDPWSADSNGDGIPDAVALHGGISPTVPDMDGDGLMNATELARGTDPFGADTDGDGTNDGADCFPLDPSRSQCPSPVPGDTTPPNIILNQPTNVTLVGSTP